MGLVTLTRRYLLQALHEIDGLESMHGHHMYVEVTARDTDPATLDREYIEKIQNRLHGRDLSHLVPNPTGENLVQWIHGELLRSPLKSKVVAVHLQETDKNRFTSSITESRHV